MYRPDTSMVKKILIRSAAEHLARCGTDVTSLGKKEKWRKTVMGTHGLICTRNLSYLV